MVLNPFLSFIQGITNLDDRAYNFICEEFGETKTADNFVCDGMYNVTGVDDINGKRGYRIIDFEGDNLHKSFDRLEAHHDFEERKGRVIVKSITDIAQGFNAFYWEARD